MLTFTSRKQEMDPECATSEGDGGVIKLDKGDFVNMRSKLIVSPKIKSSSPNPHIMNGTLFGNAVSADATTLR